MAKRYFHGIAAKSRVDALRYAAVDNKVKEIGLLLADGTDIDGISSDGYTPLAAASQSGCLRSAEALIDQGANLDLPSWLELTPLMLACSRGKAKCSRVAIRLIDAGADVNFVRKDDEMTPLKFAVRTCAPEVIQTLIDNGAEIDGPKHTGLTPLMIAARANNVDTLKVLVENGAKVSLRCKLPWAENRTAQGLAELERRNKAANYLASLNT